MKILFLKYFFRVKFSMEQNIFRGRVIEGLCSRIYLRWISRFFSDFENTWNHTLKYKQVILTLFYGILMLFNLKYWGGGFKWDNWPAVTYRNLNTFKIFSTVLELGIIPWEWSRVFWVFNWKLNYIRACLISSCNYTGIILNIDSITWHFDIFYYM